MIPVLVNPTARANRRNPRLAARFQAILGSDGRVFAPATLDDLQKVAADLRAALPPVIAIHGGDGTLHKTLSALINAWGGAPLPPVAILCGGTMNVVASSLGLRERPEVMLAQLVAAQRAGRIASLATRRKRSEDEKSVWAAHLLFTEGQTVGELQFERTVGCEAIDDAVAESVETGTLFAFFGLRSGGHLGVGAVGAQLSLGDEFLAISVFSRSVCDISSGI